MEVEDLVYNKSEKLYGFITDLISDVEAYVYSQDERVYVWDINDIEKIDVEELIKANDLLREHNQKLSERLLKMSQRIDCLYQGLTRVKLEFESLSSHSFHALFSIEKTLENEDKLKKDMYGS